MVAFLSTNDCLAESKGWFVLTCETNDGGQKPPRADREVPEKIAVHLSDNFDVTMEGFPVEAPGLRTTNTPLVFQFTGGSSIGKQTGKMSTNHGGRRGYWQREDITLYEGTFDEGSANGGYESCSSGMWPVHGGP